MSVDKDLLDQMMEGRSPGDLFGKEGILSEPTLASCRRLSLLQDICLFRGLPPTPSSSVVSIDFRSIV